MTDEATPECLALNHPAFGLESEQVELLEEAGIHTAGDFLDAAWVLEIADGPPPKGMEARMRATRLDDPELGLDPVTVADWAAVGIITCGQLDDYRRSPA